jgi:hypothetical protein
VDVLHHQLKKDTRETEGKVRQGAAEHKGLRAGRGKEKEVVISD